MRADAAVPAVRRAGDSWFSKNALTSAEDVTTALRRAGLAALFGFACLILEIVLTKLSVSAADLSKLHSLKMRRRLVVAAAITIEIGGLLYLYGGRIPAVYKRAHMASMEHHVGANGDESLLLRADDAQSESDLRAG